MGIEPIRPVGSKPADVPTAAAEIASASSGARPKPLIAESVATTEPSRPYDPIVRADTSTRRAMSRAADFRLALRRFHSVTDRVARSAGLTSRQYLLLLILESSPPRTEMRVGELAETLNLVPSSMTELLDRAESAGLVERVDSAHDGRVTQVRTTAEGRRRLRNAFRELADERRVLAGTAIELLADE